MTPSKALFFFCIAFVVGIGLESLVRVSGIVVWGLFVLGVLAVIFAAVLLYYKSESFRICSITGFCLLFLVLGILRFQISEFTIASDQLRQLNDKPEKITLEGIIIAEPDVRATSQKFKVKINGSVVLVTTGRYPEYQYLDAVQMTGRLKAPPVFEDFNYKNYLAKDGIYSAMDFPAITLTGAKHDYSPVIFTYEKIINLKAALSEALDRHFLPPGSFIMQGIVYGNDKNMPAELKEQFNITGLSHLTAVSGSNIVILISMLMILLLAMALWRQQAFFFAVGLIFFYIALIGFPISGVRSVLMGSAALLAQNMGRQNSSSRMVTLAAALLLLQNPRLLLYDAGFQLSFLASLGIVHIKPVIDYGFSRAMKKERLSFFSELVSVTLAAQIATLGIIVYNFGRISLVAPLTNFLVLPVIPVLTVLGFLVSLVGLFSDALGFLLSVPCVAMLAYMVKILEIFSDSFGAVAIGYISWIFVAGYYIALIAGLWYLRKKVVTFNSVNMV